MKERGIIMSGDNPRLIQEDQKTQTRRLPSVTNSLVDGRHWKPKDFAQLDFNHPDVFADKGPSPAGNSGPYLHVPNKDGETTHRVYFIYDVSDRLWVREAWRTRKEWDNCSPSGLPFSVGEVADPGDWPWLREQYIHYAVAPENNGTLHGKLRPSIHMPRWASRITLEILKVRVERLQDISEEDAWAEGCRKGPPTDNGGYFPAEELDDPSNPKSSATGWDCARDWYADLWDSLHGKGAWDKNSWVWVIEFPLLGKEASAGSRCHEGVAA